jgi:hypothetical protein
MKQSWFKTSNGRLSGLALRSGVEARPSPSVNPRHAVEKCSPDSFRPERPRNCLSLISQRFPTPDNIWYS